jgi:parallel beta-helix repeat protein
VDKLATSTFLRMKGFRGGMLSVAMVAAGAGWALRPAAPPPVLPVPRDIVDGATVLLECGTEYQGTLDLRGKTGVTVKTAGQCGKARISPRRPVTGWSRVAGSIYAAPIAFTPVQVAVGTNMLSVAHWPNLPWTTSTAGMPAGDLAGATLVVLENQSVIQSRLLDGNRIRTKRPFYVEGKRWMLDSPGEWAVEHGRLYAWAPDGRSPEGRAWAAAAANGIDADGSAGVVIDGVAIFMAADGISANRATRLTVLHTDIEHSYRDGIWASGSRGLRVHGSTVAHARRNGIDGWYAITGAVVTDTSISDTGMSGMPSASDGAIMFGAGADNRIDNVRVERAAYHGMNVMHNRNTSVRNSTVDSACMRLTDCGAIYTAARDGQPLNLHIEGNTVRNTKGRDTIGIYLDDSANGVTVSRNVVLNNQRGLVVHDGFDTIVSENDFSASAVLHIGLSQGAGRIHDVHITHNTFRSTHGEQTFNLEGETDFRRFATYDYNTYISSDPAVFGHTWDGRTAGVATSYSGWKALMQQDVHSHLVEPARERQAQAGFTTP